jgi:putative chitinase
MSAIRIFQEKLNVTPASGVFGAITARALRDHFKLSNIEAAHFIGQLHHETGGFRLFRENLNYTSPDRILEKFRRHIQPSEVNSFLRNPQALANRVYANRMGNGNEASMDGFRFLGRGAIQLTGRSNYTEFAKAMNNPEILSNPEIVATEYPFDSAKWFFDRNNLWSLTKDTSRASIERLTRRVNGGLNGIEDRVVQTNNALRMLTQ